MEISGSFSFLVTRVGLKADSTNDGQKVTVDGELKVTSDRCKALFGDVFHYVCFATMHQATEHNDDGDAQVTRFAYTKKGPPKWLRPAVHAVDLWGVKQHVQPEIRHIEAGDNDPAVTVGLRFVLDSNANEALIGMLGAMTGRAGKIKIKPVQAAAIQLAPADESAA